MGIIGVLVAILMPAVQAAREASRRTQCQNRLKQIGLAFANFQSAHKFFPANDGPDDKNRLKTVEGDWLQPFTNDFEVGATLRWGIASSQYKPADQPGPWTYAILPQLELESLQRDHHYVSEVAAFRCPSRGNRVAMPPVADQYGNYGGGGHAMAKTDYAANHLLIMDRPEVIKLKSIRDGLSQTILGGEKAHDPYVQTSSSWYWDEPLYIGGSNGTARSGTQISQDALGAEYRNAWGSAHNGLAQFVYADGHVETISIQTDPDVMLARLTPDGNEIDRGQN